MVLLASKCFFLLSLPGDGRTVNAPPKRRRCTRTADTARSNSVFTESNAPKVAVATSRRVVSVIVI